MASPTIPTPSKRALQDHLNGGRLIYLPDGTYKVSKRLQWRQADELAWSAGWVAYLVLQGQSRDKTVIKLADGAAGFADREHPQVVLFTASRADANAYDDASGPGNQAFGNSIRDLTVDVGNGNPGAVCIDWQVSNWIALRHVRIRGPADATVGIRLDRRDMDDIRIECGGVAGLVGLEHASRRPLAIRSSPLNGDGVGLRSQPRAGPLYLEDVVTDLDLRGNAPLWARQLNTENSAGVVTAAGVDLWILGWKQEATHPCFDLRGSTRMKLWGGYLYTVGSWQDRSQAIITLDAQSKALLSVCGVCFVGGGMAPELVRRDGTEITRQQARWRGEGFNLPLAVLPRAGEETGKQMAERRNGGRHPGTSRG